MVPLSDGLWFFSEKDWTEILSKRELVQGNMDSEFLKQKKQKQCRKRDLSKDDNSV